MRENCKGRYYLNGKSAPPYSFECKLVLHIGPTHQESVKSAGVGHRGCGIVFQFSGI